MSDQTRRKSDARESGIVQRVRNSASALPFKRPRVLLACSAGKDSVALASVLGDLHRLEAIELSIAHIHHGQHDAADAAADAVIAIADELGVRSTVHRLNQADIDSHFGVGLEEALRRERYMALAQIAVEHVAECIAIAHHETDQAETILLHLMRGSGLDGLAGMRQWELRKIPWWDDEPESSEIGLWRPLLSEPATTIAAIAEQSGLPIVEDPTNTDTAFRRNAIRRDLLPLIEQIAPGSTSAIARTAGLIARDADYLTNETSRQLDRVVVDGSLIRNRLIELPDSLQLRVVRAWIQQAQPALELTSERVESVIRLAVNNRGGAQVELGSGVKVRLRNGRLELNPWQNEDN